MFRDQKYFIFFCVVMCSGTAFARLAQFSEQQYGYEYISKADGWLRLHSVPATWTSALLRCILEGGTLASPSSSAIMTAMKSKMFEQQQTLAVFIGIRAALTTENYVSLDGVAFSNMSLTWAIGQPDNKDGGQDCLVMVATGAVADESCASVYRYFCYKNNSKSMATKYNSKSIETKNNSKSMETKIDTNGMETKNNSKSMETKIDTNSMETKNNSKSMETKNTTCEDVNQGYKLEPRTGSCYKIHTNPSNWYHAGLACRAEHAHLAVINSDTEAQVLKELFAKHPAETIDDGANEPYLAYLGYYLMEEKEWLTIFDQTPTEAGYDKWEHNVPSPLNNTGTCGTIDHSGLLYAMRCDYQSPFFCEITA